VTQLRVAPRRLHLAADAAVVRRQLAGEALARDAVGPLRDEVTTDEIIPLAARVHVHAALGRHPYTGFKAGAERPIGVDAVRRAGIEVVLAGARGLKVAPGVKACLQFGTVDVREHGVPQGCLAAFAAVGVELPQPACGA
jgi:aconitase A